MSSGRRLILRALLWLVEQEQRRLDGMGGPWNEDAPGRVLAREIEAELEEEEAEAAREVLLTGRQSEKTPVQDGKLKEKEHGDTGAED
jgi:hypothetical protein